MDPITHQATFQSVSQHATSMVSIYTVRPDTKNMDMIWRVKRVIDGSLLVLVHALSQTFALP